MAGLYKNNRGICLVVLMWLGLTTVDDFIIIYFSQDQLDPNQKARVFTCAFDNSSR